jgi:hypothetical protein
MELSADRHAAVLTSMMQISVESSQQARPYRKGNISRSYEVIQALRRNPVGSWLSVDLGALPGPTVTAKQNSVARAARRHFRPIHVHVEGPRLFIRRGHDPMLPPINRTKRPRPVFFRKPPLRPGYQRLPNRRAPRAKWPPTTCKTTPGTWLPRLTNSEEYGQSIVPSKPEGSEQWRCRPLAVNLLKPGANRQTAWSTKDD